MAAHCDLSGHTPASVPDQLKAVLQACSFPWKQGNFRVKNTCFELCFVSQAVFAVPPAMAAGAGLLLQTQNLTQSTAMLLQGWMAKPWHGHPAAPAVQFRDG